MKCPLVIFIIAVTLLSFAHDIYSEELPLYPKNRQYALHEYEIGVETRVATNINMEFTFKNTVDLMKDWSASTEGTFIIEPEYKVMFIKVHYVLVNKDKKVVRVVFVLNQGESENIIKFSCTYPYSPDYEYCVFHIMLLLIENTKPEGVPSNGHTHIFLQ